MATATFEAENSKSIPSFSPFTILKALGSLKITVAMFALGILIILFGTLAQDEMDLTGVKKAYFTSWIAYIHIDVLFPITLSPHDTPYWGGFYFPGGATIGLVLLINLIAAKATRFGIQAKGAQLSTGVIVSAIGAGLVTAVIMSGHATSGLQGKPPIEYDTLWNLMRFGCATLAAAMIGYSIFAKVPPLARNLSIGAAVILTLLSIALITDKSLQLDDSGLRIVWQLLQASVASLVLLAGLCLLFKKRGGNVLIHIGVGLLMVGQFVFGDRQIEQRMTIIEGRSTNLAFNMEKLEIAIIDVSNPAEDVVHVVPDSTFKRVAGTDKLIEDEVLPCKLRIKAFYKNSKIEAALEGSKNLATAGFGVENRAVEATPVGGAVMNAINLASAYVEVLDKQGVSLGTYLLSQERNDTLHIYMGGTGNSPEEVEIDGKKFELALRYRQEHKPYDIFLKDVVRIDYTGTDTPRDYSSVIDIIDRETGDSQEDKTWMNNPIRYRGETFYQSSYSKVPTSRTSTVEVTGLQIVENAGWVIPYVCCMMVLWGMAAHFGEAFFRFASRLEREERVARKKGIIKPTSLPLIFGTAAGGIALPVIVAASLAMPKRYESSQIDWNRVASIPVQDKGRIKPLDTVARHLLKTFAEPIFGMTPTIKDKEGNKYSPSQWFLSVLAGKPWTVDAEIFRVYNQSVKNFLELDPSRESSRYSYREIIPKMEDLSLEIQEIRKRPAEKWSFRDQKLVDVYGKINLYFGISQSYRDPMPAFAADDLNSTEELQAFAEAFRRARFQAQELQQGNPPALIPPPGEATKENLASAKWQAYGPAIMDQRIEVISKGDDFEENEAVNTLAEILAKYQVDDVLETNKAIKKHVRLLEDMPLAATQMSGSAAEAWLNRFSPIVQGVALYIFAITLGLIGILLRNNTAIRMTTSWMIVGVLVIHSIAIIARIYISGKAPVVNLYSASIFIGWVTVVVSLVMEYIYKIGIANLVGALIGACTLSVAGFLDTNDTMAVLQAVLDTQFWLSTHVVTVTAGYGVTYLAGFLGFGILLMRLFTKYDSYPQEKRPKKAQALQRIMYSMCYGAVCFGIFFSFIGTVLGGLWADDSWGRFWGWDPKENGAMMIVMWNALLLHARWDKQVAERGFAALAIMGNAITTWSFFGTNQLGIGLHAYGGAAVGQDESAPTLNKDLFEALRENGSYYTTFGFIIFNIAFILLALFITSLFKQRAKASE